MKHSICNIQLLPKAADLRNKAFDKFRLNPFAPGDFAEKRVLKLVEWFSGHCRAIRAKTYH